MASRPYTQKVSKVIEIPKQDKGYIIGSQKTGLKKISQSSKARVFLKDNEVWAEGTPDEIKVVEKMIAEKLAEKHTRIIVRVPTKYVGLIRGKHGSNKDRIETKSTTEIRLLPANNEGKDQSFREFAISGSLKKCSRARSLISDCILSFNQNIERKKFGVKNCTRPVCFNHNDDKAKFSLVENRNAPKSDGTIDGYRYRIVTEKEASKEVHQNEFSEDTISAVTGYLLKALTRLHGLKDKEQLKIDLWGHFGNVFVHSVDEGENKKYLELNDVLGRIGNLLSKYKGTASDVEEDDAIDHVNWKAMFEEGIDLQLINKGILPEDGDTEHFLRHFRTQWRYDYAFKTMDQNIRFKVWEKLVDEDGLPVKDPPCEVKNLLNPVYLEGHDDDVVAWLCYPSLTIIKGEIMTPDLKYDCRLKLRAGKRYAEQENQIQEEELKKLTKYLSKCTLDTENHCLELPSSDLPEDFQCSFHRSSKEMMYSCEGDDNETFTVIVLEESGWDSDSAEKRDQKQFGIRVVMDSWSDALLSGEWEADDIVKKLPIFMNFFYTLQKMLFQFE